jgi:hypothetical protein
LETALVSLQQFLLAMCKIGKLSFVAGAEIPKKYLAG